MTPDYERIVREEAEKEARQADPMWRLCEQLESLNKNIHYGLWYVACAIVIAGLVIGGSMR